MSKKWFDPKPKEEILLQYVPTVRPTHQDVDKLAMEMKKRGISNETVQLLLGRANLDLKQRLSINLRITLSVLALSECRDTLNDGLTQAEHRALVELQLRNMSMESLVIAHAVLNIAERKSILDTFNSMYSALRK
jgi:hypothetical protein